MSHAQQREFCERICARFPPASLTGPVPMVADLGSLDVNGNNHHLFPGTVPGESYVGVDVAPGRNVHVVSTARDFRPGHRFDCVISTEMLEHDAEWQDSLRNAYDLLRPGGLLILTCAGPGRPEHGTARSEPTSSPNQRWPDYYANLTGEDLLMALGGPEGFVKFGIEYEREPSADTRFWGIKK